MNWNKLSDVKPHQRGWYLVMDKDGITSEASVEEWIPPSDQHDGYFEWEGFNGCYKPDENVVYWLSMPIPEPSK